MIRVLVVDDHQAVRAGVVALLRQEPGFVPVATASTVEEALPLVSGAAVDVAVVDYRLPDAPGVDLCRRLPHTVGSVLYTALAPEEVVVAALVAGARAVVPKSAPADELFDALREAARGRTAHAPVTRRALATVVNRVSEEDWAIVGMALERTPPAGIAEALGIAPAELEQRIDRVLGALCGSGRAAAGGRGGRRRLTWSLG